MSHKRDGIVYLEGDKIVPTNMWKNQVEDFAQKVFDVGGFEIGGDLADLVQRFGGALHYESMDEYFEENGSIFVHDERDFDIVVPIYTSPLRDRFTIAHELGHYFLHSNQGRKPLIAFRKGSTRIEWEANWFAAALLMPSAEFKAAWSEHDDLPAVAGHFGVSQEAAQVRKNALGLS